MAALLFGVTLSLLNRCDFLLLSVTFDFFHRAQRLVVIEEADTTLDGLGVAVSALRKLVGEMVPDFGVSFEVGSVEEDQN